MRAAAALPLLCAAAAGGRLGPPPHRRAARPAGPARRLPLDRPSPELRTFRSSSVDAVVEELYPQLKEGVAELFHNCFPNTLDTTVQQHDAGSARRQPDSFVITGDIPAMWLRDSTNQVLPYLPFAAEDAPLRRLLCGLVHAQARGVRYDPYANAFNYNETSAPGGGNHQDDDRRPPMTTRVWEGKYELDSLAAFLKLSAAYHEHTLDDACFDSEWRDAVVAAVDTIEREQQSTDEDQAAGWWYIFRRETPQATDTLMQWGVGPPAARTGMSKSQFRGSDDAQTLPFHVPANAMASVELRRVAALLTRLSDAAPRRRAWRRDAERAERLGAAIDAGIRAHGVMPDGSWAFEVDGFGSQYFMDDANVPSLLALPWLGYCSADDATYLATRQKVLTRATNPFYFSGPRGAAVGGPHVGYNMAWPMAIISQALTSLDEVEIVHCLDMLVQSSAGTGFLHETFNVTDEYDFTREWFAWVNTYFGQLVLQLVHERPHLVLTDPARNFTHPLLRRKPRAA